MTLPTLRAVIISYNLSHILERMSSVRTEFNSLEWLPMAAADIVANTGVSGEYCVGGILLTESCVLWVNSNG